MDEYKTVRPISSDDHDETLYIYHAIMNSKYLDERVTKLGP